MSSDLDEHGSEQPSVITRYSTLAPDAAYASSGEETSLASFEIFSAAAALRARSETAGTTSPRLKAGRSPPQCSRAPPDALLCRDAPKPIFTGNIPSLSAQNSPRTASQRVIFNPQHAKVVIFACAPALFVIFFEPTRTGFLKMGVGIGEPQHLPQPCSDKTRRPNLNQRPPWASPWALQTWTYKLNHTTNYRDFARPKRERASDGEESQRPRWSDDLCWMQRFKLRCQ